MSKTDKKFLEWLSSQSDKFRKKMDESDSMTTTAICYGKSISFIEASEKFKEIKDEKIDKMGEDYGEK